MCRFKRCETFFPLGGLFSRSDPVQVQVGRFRSSVGHGLVYDAYGTGIESGVDLSLADLCPLRLQLQAIAVGCEPDDLAEPNPLIAARGDWDLSLFESIGIFAAVFFDRDGEPSEVMRSRNAIAPSASCPSASSGPFARPSNASATPVRNARLG